jgi:hypothetical protein
MKDLSPAAGAPAGNKVGSNDGGLRPIPLLTLPPASPPRSRAVRCGAVRKAGEAAAVRGLAAAGLLGLVSPSSQQICHPYAQDHNRISSIRPGKEAFKLLILSRERRQACQGSAL